MSVSLHAPRLPWAQAHRMLLTVVLVCVALVAAAGVLVARSVGGDGAAGTTSVSDLQPLDDGCQTARPGQAC
jgi:hypothetical protein